MSQDKASPQWYLIQVKGNFEDKVAENLLDKIKMEKNTKISNSVMSVLVPKIQETVIKQGRTQIVNNKIYPGYVMFQAIFDDDVWHFLKGTKNVLNVLTTPMKQKDVHDIMEKMKSSAEKPKKKVIFSVGQSVRITEGPFKDFSGVVERIDDNKNRLHLSVSIFGRSTSVEATFDDVAAD